MKYKTLAVLAFAGVLVFSGTALAKSSGTNDPTPDKPFDEMQRVRKMHDPKEQEKDRWPVFIPGKQPEFKDSDDARRPSRPQEGTRPSRKPPEFDGKKPPEHDHRARNDHSTPSPRRPHSRDKRPPEFRR